MKRREGRFWSIFCSSEDWTGKLRLEEGSLECIRLCVFLVFFGRGYIGCCTYRDTIITNEGAFLVVS